MNTTSSQPPPTPPPRPHFPFSLVFLVCIVTFIIATLVTFILPEQYVSTARLRIEHDHTDIAGLATTQAPPWYDAAFAAGEFEVLQSELVLGRVIDELKLREYWGKKLADGAPLVTPLALKVFRGKLDLRQIRNCNIIEVWCYDEDPKEAARLANAVVEAYREYRLERRKALASTGIDALQRRWEEQEAKIREAQKRVDELRKQLGIPETATNEMPATRESLAFLDAKEHLENLQRFRHVLYMKIASETTDLGIPAQSMVEIIDRAAPGLRPIKPNKSLNLALGAIIGGFAGLLLASLVYLLQWRHLRRTSASPVPSSVRKGLHTIIGMCTAVFVGYLCATSWWNWDTILIVLSVFVGALASIWVETRVQQGVAVQNPGSLNQPDSQNLLP